MLSIDVDVDRRSPFKGQVDFCNLGVNREGAAIDPFELDGVLIGDSGKLSFEVIRGLGFTHVEVWG
jgi:hypothetical protein